MRRLMKDVGRWITAPALLLLIGGCDAADIVRASLQLAAAIIEAAD